jgi:hypothetical protein
LKEVSSRVGGRGPANFFERRVAAYQGALEVSFGEAF